MRFFLALSLCFLLLLGFTGCDRDDDPSPDPAPETGRLVKKLQVSENDYQLFEYGTAKEVKYYRSQWQSSPDGHISRIDYHFTHTDGRLQLLNTAVSKTNYTYANGKLVSAENLAINGRKISTHEFVFDNNGRLGSITEHITEPDQISSVRMRYTYYANGNVEKMEFGSLKVGENNFVPDYTKLFEAYDDQPQPIPSAVWEHFIPGLVLQHNNPLRIKNIDKNGNVMDIIHMTYAYDADGYPTKRDQHTEKNGQAFPFITYQYFY